MTKRFLILFLLSIVCYGLTFAQTGDTTVIVDQPDTILEKIPLDTAQLEWDDYEEAFYYAAADSAKIDVRKFDENEVERLKNDPAFDYKEPPTVAQSLWERFKIWFAQFMKSIFDNAVHTNWGRVIVFVIGIALLVVLIMLMLKVNAFRMIYSGDGAVKQYNILDENIHEMDFEKLIADAVNAGDFRRGIRLLFLHALKLLSDKHFIQWESGKTNHDYVEELKEPTLRVGLNELSRYFDYAWYGNFAVDKATFVKAQDAFSQWKNNIR